MKNTLSLYFILCFGMLFQPICSMTQDMDMSWTKKVGAKDIPKGTKQYDVINFGAKSDGKTSNTHAIQETIDACASAGGGIVTFSEKGKYLTGSLYIKEGVHFIVPKGVVLLGSTHIEDYPDINTRIAGIEMIWPSALINVIDQKKVMICGEGIIHAQGKRYWDSYWKLRKEYEAKGLRWIVDYDSKRPRTLLVSKSSDVTIKDLTFQQAGFWTIQLLYSNNCTVDGVVIQNNVGGHGPSTDGIDIDSSSHILVQNCDIDCNDDNFCLKAGRDADGLRVNRPTEYVVIRNCISRTGGGLLTCGSETSGGIRYVLADGLKAKGTNVGIRLKSAMNRGGTTEHIYINNIELENVGTVFEATMNWNPAYSYSKLPKEYEGKPIPEHWTKMLEKVDTKLATPYFKDIHLANLKVTNAQTFVNVAGSKNSMMTNFQFKDIEADVVHIGDVDYAKDWTFTDVRINAKDFEALRITHSQNVNFENQSSPMVVNFTKEFSDSNCNILISDRAEFAFLLPEMAGNLKFGIIGDKQSKWLSTFSKVETTDSGTNRITYTLSDPILDKGSIRIDVIRLSNTDGIVVEVSPLNIPSNTQLLWAFGGAYGKVLGKNESKALDPRYCLYNVFSVEQTAFTVYYGESMKLKVLQGVMPLNSEIRLSNSYNQNTPSSFFNSGKKTNSPALSGLLPLQTDAKEYFCIYKQNEKADYNYYMLADLFKTEKNK